jgi:hypothetical protein
MTKERLDEAMRRFDRRKEPRIPFTYEGLQMVAHSVQIIGTVVGAEIQDANKALTDRLEAVERQIASLRCQRCA